MTRRPPDGTAADRVGRLYDRFAGLLYRYALMILANPAAAADAVHDVFVSVLRRDVTLVDDEHYLRRAVRNQCYSVLRRRRVRGEPQEATWLEPVAPPDDPLVRLLVAQAVSALPPEQREVVHMKTYEGWTFQEIAQLTDESPNTVASRYRYALERMRVLLGDRVTD